MLYIYSGDVPELDDALLAALGDKHRLTVIPSALHDMASARYTVGCLRASGLRARLLGTRFYRDPDCLRQVVMNSDAIYLMGGNTFEFLDYAQRVELFDLIHEFEAAGGIVVAESAGSIILSPNIATALIPSSCPDEHLLELEDYTGMGRIPFHISPHYDSAATSAQRDRYELACLARHSAYPVWLLADGEGLIIDGDQVVRVVGEPLRLTLEMAADMAVDQVGDSELAVVDCLPEWAARSSVMEG